MNRKAQTLMISLWILAVLTVLAVGIGHRVSMALRISRYHRDSLKALGLAKAGVNLAIAQLNQDANAFDALNEGWSDNEAIFKKIILSDDPDEFATVSYSTLDEANNPKTIYGVRDLEARININTASKELLLALLEKSGVSNAQDLVNNILIWRGDIPDDGKIYPSLGYPCKSTAFANVEELSLIKDFQPEDFQKIYKWITVFQDNLININTASSEVLAILCRSIAKASGIDESFADSLATKILELRKNKGYFQDKSEIDLPLIGAEEGNIFNTLMNNIAFTSGYFLIEVTGNSSKIKRKIEAVYFRKDKKILYWHES